MQLKSSWQSRLQNGMPRRCGGGTGFPGGSRAAPRPRSLYRPGNFPPAEKPTEKWPRGQRDALWFWPWRAIRCKKGYRPGGAEKGLGEVCEAASRVGESNQAGLQFTRNPEGAGMRFVCWARTNEEHTCGYAAATSEEGNGADGKITGLPKRQRETGRGKTAARAKRSNPRVAVP